MGAWYRVVKKVKGRRYAYLQRTWRNGKTVHTENQYLGPVDGAGRVSEPRARAGEHTGPAGHRVAYHGARNGLDGPIQASPEGTFESVESTSGWVDLSTQREEVKDYLIENCRGRKHPRGWCIVAIYGTITPYPNWGGQWIIVPDRLEFRP